jgi:hypothetical protein
MPYEDTLPLLASLLLLTFFFTWIWRSSGQCQWAFIALLICAAGCGVAAIDFFIQTDREQVELLLPELAKAVEKKDLETLLAAIAPESRTVQEQAKKAVLEVKPSHVLITRLNVDVLYDQRFPRAVADLLVRVTGKFVGREEGTAMVSATVTLEKREQWVVTECIVKPADPLNERKTTRAGQVIR